MAPRTSVSIGVSPAAGPVLQRQPAPQAAAPHPFRAILDGFIAQRDALRAQFDAKTANPLKILTTVVGIYSDDVFKQWEVWRKDAIRIGDEAFALARAAETAIVDNRLDTTKPDENALEEEALRFAERTRFLGRDASGLLLPKTTIVTVIERVNDTTFTTVANFRMDLSAWLKQIKDDYTATWRKPAAGPAPGTAAPPPTVQPKLVVGPVDDPLEREADQLADRVLRMPAPVASAPQPASAASSIGEMAVQRQCAHCREEQERLQRRERSDGDGVAPGALTGVDAAVRGPGQPLAPAVRAFMEPRFGCDFGQVRVHADAAAAASARALNALAYTTGQHLVFDRGQYAPHTNSGSRLLAHELAHVVQQGAAGRIRRAPAKPTPLPATVPTPGPSDFNIERVATSTPSAIFFGRGSSTLDAGALAQVAAIKAAAPSSVRLIGFSSADEGATVAQARADAVAAALKAPPNPVSVSSAAGNASAQAGRSDFVQARKVEVIVGAAAASTLDCAATDPVSGALVNPPKQPCPAMDPDTWTAFNNALPIASDAMKRATAAVAGTPSAGDAALIDRFFGNHDAATLATLKTNLGNLEKHVNNLPAITQCGGQCDAGNCDGGSTIAYNQDVDAASTMTLCVPVFKGMNANDQARNLIHESAHGTTPLGGPAAPGKGTRDVAYRHERMLFELPPADRLRNSDSYALFALFLREVQKTGLPDAAPAGISTPAKDSLSGFSTTELPALKRALARLEKRLTWCSDWMGQLYGQVLQVRSGGLAWSAAWSRQLMTEVASRFPVSAPAAPPTKPSLTDQVRVAGIAERYKRMHAGVKRDLTVTPMAAGAVSWTATPTWIPMGPVTIGPDFFAATADDQVSVLLEALAKATASVEAAFIPAYVSLAEWIHGQNT